MNNEQYIHVYRPHSGAHRPVITVAMVLDRREDDSVRGLAIGSSFCSVQDHPSKRRGNAIARGRAVAALKHAAEARAEAESKGEDNPEKVCIFYRTRYGQNKTELDINQEPYQTGHPHFSYVPFPPTPESLKNLEIPEDKYVKERIVRALDNIKKRNSL